MIYIADSTQATDLYFPRTTEVSQYVSNGMIQTELVLVCTATREKRVEGGFVIPAGGYLLAEAFATDPALDPGEWEYTLLTSVPTEGEETPQAVLLASGIIRVGELPAEAPVQYDKPVEYEQYNG